MSKVLHVYKYLTGYRLHYIYFIRSFKFEIMPLPATLAAKLAKRGLIIPKPRSELKGTTSYKGFEGCPNKYNIHHECTKFCITRWKVGVLEPGAKYLLRREKMLKKYPLPLNWKEIYDRGCGRFYYWDTDKDLVSWLPPKHPKSTISFSAAYLREEMQIRLAMLNEKREIEERRKRASSEERENNKKDKLIKLKNHKRPHGKDNLDPMDPAAYSDIPRGTWSSGLETRAEAKTGADTTASGPLYQMRPYPSPGAILAANAKTKHTRT